MQQADEFGLDVYKDFQKVAYTKCNAVLENICEDFEECDEYANFIISIDDSKIDYLKNAIYDALAEANDEVTNNGTIYSAYNYSKLDGATLFVEYINFDGLCDDYYEEIELEEV